MKRKPVIRLAAGAVVAIALAGCSVSEPGDADPASDEAADMTPEGPSVLSKLTGGGKPMALDIQQPHPNGVILQINSLQAKPSETVIRATITNGDDREQMLNASNNKTTYIVTGDGSKLYLSPPTGNPKLAVPGKQRMEAELVFLGRLSDSGNATLIFNDGTATDNQYTARPGFRIPLPLSDAAFSDDGSKKN